MDTYEKMEKSMSFMMYYVIILSFYMKGKYLIIPFIMLRFLIYYWIMILIELSDMERLINVQ